MLRGNVVSRQDVGLSVFIACLALLFCLDGLRLRLYHLSERLLVSNQAVQMMTDARHIEVLNSLDEVDVPQGNSFDFRRIDHLEG